MTLGSRGSLGQRQPRSGNIGTRVISYSVSYLLTQPFLGPTLLKRGNKGTIPNMRGQMLLGPNNDIIHWPPLERWHSGPLGSSIWLPSRMSLNIGGVCHEICIDYAHQQYEPTKCVKD